MEGLTFPPDGSKKLDGIIAYLTRKCGGNVHDKGIVKIVGHDPLNDLPHFSAKVTADFAGTNYYKSREKPEQYIEWDFGKLRILPTHYAIRNANGPWNMKSWVIQGSLKGADWVKMDDRDETRDLKAANAVQVFELAKSVECRYIRLQQTDRNHDNSHFMIFAAVEFFGTLVEP
jgi:hypothetical protein